MGQEAGFFREEVFRREEVVQLCFVNCHMAGGARKGGEVKCFPWRDRYLGRSYVLE